MSSFVEKCLSGDALLEEIDEYVARWHAGGPGTLPDFLGMTMEEYELWINDPDMLPLIVTARRRKTRLRNLIEENLPLAARAKDLDQTLELVNWLKKEGLWKPP